MWGNMRPGIALVLRAEWAAHCNWMSLTDSRNSDFQNDIHTDTDFNVDWSRHGQYLIHLIKSAAAQIPIHCIRFKLSSYREKYSMSLLQIPDYSSQHFEDINNANILQFTNKPKYVILIYTDSKIRLFIIGLHLQYLNYLQNAKILKCFKCFTMSLYPGNPEHL